MLALVSELLILGGVHLEAQEACGIQGTCYSLSCSLLLVPAFGFQGSSSLHEWLYEVFRGRSVRRKFMHPGLGSGLLPKAPRAREAVFQFHECPAKVVFTQRLLEFHDLGLQSWRPFRGPSVDDPGLLGIYTGSSLSPSIYIHMYIYIYIYEHMYTYIHIHIHMSVYTYICYMDLNTHICLQVYKGAASMCACIYIYVFTDVSTGTYMHPHI